MFDDDAEPQPDLLAMAAAYVVDNGVHVVVLAEHSDGSGWRLELQRGEEIDEQDRRLGLDAHCLVTHAQATHYGGVTSWRLADGVLSLELTSEAAQELNVPDDLVVRMPVGDSAREQVRRGLAVILDGVPGG